MRVFSRTLLVLLVCTVVLVASPTNIFAQQQVFTPQDLAQFDGKDGRKAYTAYEGVVYDVTGSALWKMGEHFGLQAGKDLTAEMANAPHGPEVFAKFEVVGTLQSETTLESQPEVSPVAAPAAVPNAQKWYSGRLSLWGISILGWSGILLGIFFVLTFATCFAMPWAQLRLPWIGQKPGPDQMDASGKHLPFTAIHKHFVWFTVIFGVIHGVLGVLQLFGIYL